MKTTVKQYQENVKLKADTKRLKEEAIDLGQSFSSYQEILDELESNYFSKLNKIAISYMIGSRVYYESAIKIGKAYLKHGERMTQSRGYYCIEEISEITEDMTNSMIADSYYY